MCICATSICGCLLTEKIHQMQQTQRVLQFLMKLNYQFSTIRGSIPMMSPLPSVTQAYRMVAQEENHKEISQSNHIDNLAFVTDRRFNQCQGHAQSNQGTKSQVSYQLQRPNLYN